MDIAIDRFAVLARLSLDEKEKKQLETDLSAILAYAEQLRDVDTAEGSELIHAAPETNVLRADEVSKKIKEDEIVFPALLHDRIPEREQDYIRVPLIIKKS